MVVREGQRGRLFEDFEVGDVYEHPLGRTVTTTDIAWFKLLTQNTAPVLFSFHEYWGHRRTLLPEPDQGMRSRAARYASAKLSAQFRPLEAHLSRTIVIQQELEVSSGRFVL
jgi:hypothetical protein